MSSRTFGEYRAMFGLSDADLRSRVLDCPGGAASFTAEAAGHGCRAVAADPEYARGPGRLADLVLAETGHKHAALVERAADFEWSWLGGPGDHRLLRSRAARRFAADAARRPGRYVAAALPHLPFRDGAFDLALSSHLLFSYGARLDEDFHRAALAELVRVSRQVRLYPLVSHTEDVPYPGLDRLRAWAARHGVASRLVPVDYRFQRGAHKMLVLDRGAGRLPAARGGAHAGDPVRWRHLEQARDERSP
ncbi:methyltransferase domain-containing protein [Nocardiopsis flavescens]